MISKDTKITYFIYAPYECAAVEEYLEQMAAKGWLLQWVKGPLFKFKKITPQKIKYSVDVLNKISIFDPKNSEVALEYREYCQTAGWIYICQTGKIQIFYAEADKKITPIHTDEGEKFKVVFKSSLYQIINQLFIFIILIFNIYNELFFGNTDFLLSSNFMIVSTVIMFFLAFANIIQCISFFIWVINAKRKLKQNKFIPYNSYKQLQIKNLISKTFCLILILTLLTFLFFDNSSYNKDANVFIFIIMFIPIIIASFIKILINKKKYSKNNNIIITISSYIASIFLVLILAFSIAILSVTQFPQNKMSNEKANLTLMDFEANENSTEYNYTNFDKSILAQRRKYSYSTKSKYLSFTILQSQYPSVIKFHEEKLLSRLNSYGMGLNHNNSNLPSNVKVYSDSKKRTFILVSEDKVVDITKDFNTIDDDKFLDIVYEKLFKE